MCPLVVVRWGKYNHYPSGGWCCGRAAALRQHDLQRGNRVPVGLPRWHTEHIIGMASGAERVGALGTASANTIRKDVLTPPPKRVPRYARRGGGGGGGGQNPKNHWVITFGPAVMILQGVRRQNTYPGVCHTNDPKIGGYMTPAPALDLTTSLPGDLPPMHHPVLQKMCSCTGFVPENQCVLWGNLCMNPFFAIEPCVPTGCPLHGPLPLPRCSPAWPPVHSLLGDSPVKGPAASYGQVCRWTVFEHRWWSGTYWGLQALPSFMGGMVHLAAPGGGQSHQPLLNEILHCPLRLAIDDQRGSGLRVVGFRQQLRLMGIHPCRTMRPSLGTRHWASWGCWALQRISVPLQASQPPT